MSFIAFYLTKQNHECRVVLNIDNLKFRYIKSILFQNSLDSGCISLFLSLCVHLSIHRFWLLLLKKHFSHSLETQTSISNTGWSAYHLHINLIITQFSILIFQKKLQILHCIFHIEVNKTQVFPSCVWKQSVKNSPALLFFSLYTYVRSVDIL